MKKKNPLEDLLKIWEDSIKEEDKKGWAGFYKTSTEYLLESITKEFEGLFHAKPVGEQRKMASSTVTPIDLKYGDGYFIFARGTNTTNCFRIKELPGWLFGIWWKEPKKVGWVNPFKEEPEKYTISGEVFWQWEKEIDKFKPSASVFLYQIELVYDTESKQFHVNNINSKYWEKGLGGMVRELAFMSAEPELAFCREYHGWDYNKEQHTRAAAKKEWKKYVDFTAKKEKMIPELDERVLNLYKNKFKEDFELGRAVLLDHGKYLSPRYELCLKKEGFEELKGCEGEAYVHISELFADKKEGKEFVAELKACRKLAEKNGFYWFNPVDENVQILETRHFNKRKKINESLQKEAQNGQ